MLALDVLIEQMKPREFRFGMNSATRYLPLLFKLGYDIASREEPREGMMSLEKTINMILNMGIHDSNGEENPGKWNEDIKLKAARVINHILPGIMFEIFKDDPNDHSDLDGLIERQSGREAFQSTIDALMETEASKMILFLAEEAANNPKEWDEGYDSLWADIDNIQKGYEDGKYSAEYYNKVMAEASVFISMVENLNDNYFLPQGDWRYPSFIKGVISATMAGVVHTLKKKGLVD